MSRIKEAFSKGKAFIPFITAGYPNLAVTRSVLAAAERGGADLIEIGVPFSDPTAEGPVIQGANVKALSNGITTDRIFEFVQSVRESGEVTVPLVFMTYANVVYSYHVGGADSDDGSDGRDMGKYGFFRRCRSVGIDGIILPDVPFEERGEFSDAAKASDIDLISMVAPTSDKRIRKIAMEAEGFIYVVSSLGVTGMRSEITTDIGAITKKLREVTSVPCAVGFGISTPAQAKKMASLSDGAIVGSAIIKIIGEHGRDAAPHVYEYVKSMKEAVMSAS